MNKSQKIESQLRQNILHGLYHTGDQQHEKDACDVLERLDYFVRNLSKESQKAKNE